MPQSKIHPYSTAGQCVTLILSALDELRSIRTKQETIDYIGRQHWFAFEPEDQKPYPSNVHTTKEPRWQTLLAWGRKNGFQREWLMPHMERDSWEISRDGIAKLKSIVAAYEQNSLKVGRCYLWSAIFKKRLDPEYIEGTDAPRPSNVYKDVFSQHVFDDII